MGRHTVFMAQQSPDPSTFMTEQCLPSLVPDDKRVLNLVILGWLLGIRLMDVLTWLAENFLFDQKFTMG